MKKYKRRTINQKPELHDKVFVTVDDCQELMMQVAAAAVKAGADESKMMKYLTGVSND